MLGAQPLVVQKGIGHFISLIYRIRKNIYYCTGSLGAVCIMMCHLFSRKINDTLKLFKKVPLVRGALYASVLNCSLLVYFASKASSFFCSIAVLYNFSNLSYRVMTDIDLALIYKFLCNQAKI